MAIDLDLQLGTRLRRRRKVLGLTQAQLAEKMGMRFQQIQKYECGANRMLASRLWQLAQALETTIEYFFDGLEDEREEEKVTIRRREQLELAEVFIGLPSNQRERVLGFAKTVHLEQNLRA